MKRIAIHSAPRSGSSWLGQKLVALRIRVDKIVSVRDQNSKIKG